jgi:TolB-like protein
LSRRNVFRVAIVYLAVAWLLLQVTATVAPILDLPVQFEKSVLLLLALGFPVAVILAWAFELTAAGLKRDTGPENTRSARRRTFDSGVIFILALAVGYFVVDKYFLEDSGPEQSVGNSVAVLPLANMSQDAANEPFVLGIHDDLLTRLSRIKSLRTVSRTSVLQYRGTDKTIPEIAAALGVATVLEGGVQRSGDRVRINVQLIDAATDKHLWAETYDRELTAANVFDIQSDISRKIAAQLRATLTKDDERRLDSVPTQSLDALSSYFTGKQLLELRTRESLTAAVEYFEQVVAIDPDFALGWSGLADAYMLLPEYSAMVDREVIGERSTYAVARALELDADLPYVSSSAAWSKLIHNYDWRGAEETFRHALQIEPDNTNVLHWLSHTLSWQGRHEEAVAAARNAREVEPQSKLMAMNLAYILVDARRYDEALQIANDVRRSNPGYTAMRRNLFLHELRSGHVTAGADSFVGYTTMIGGEPEAAREIGNMFVAYAERGEIGQLGEELIRRALLGSEDLAQVMASIGNVDGTLDALKFAIEQRSGSRSVLSMKINPAYDFIREDPRFVAMLKQVGLSD